MRDVSYTLYYTRPRQCRNARVAISHSASDIRKLNVCMALLLLLSLTSICHTTDLSLPAYKALTPVELSNFTIYHFTCTEKQFTSSVLSRSKAGFGRASRGARRSTGFAARLRSRGRSPVLPGSRCPPRPPAAPPPPQFLRRPASPLRTS